METTIIIALGIFPVLILVGAYFVFARHWKAAIITGATLLLYLILLLSLKPWGFVDNYQLGYMFDSRTGKITVLDRTGYHLRAPFFQSIHTIDLRPRQVCITVGATAADSANQRVLNCKLVEFDPKGLDLFISWHGRGDYSGSTLDDLLKIYAYDGTGKTYPFLQIKTELKDADGTKLGAATVPSSAPVPTGEPK